MRAVLGFSLLFFLVHYYLRTYMPTLAEIEMLMEGARKVIVTLDIGRRGSLPPFERDIASVCWNNYRVFYAKKKRSRDKESLLTSDVFDNDALIEHLASV